MKINESLNLTTAILIEYRSIISILPKLWVLIFDATFIGNPQIIGILNSADGYLRTRRFL